MKLVDKDFNKLIEEVFNEHKAVLEALAPYDTLEYEIGEWLVNNKDFIEEKLNLIRKDKSDMFPESVYEIYAHQYEEEAIKLIRKEISEALNLDPENSLRVNKESISLTSLELLNPKKSIKER